MTFLPIVERELRVAARRPSTYRTRFFAVVGMLAVWLFLLATNQVTPAAKLSGMLFVALGVLALGFAMLAGVFLTADCLSEEKREETLGLLFLTDLKGYDVVFGKLAATSLHAVYGVLGVIPLLALPVLMGGVSGGAFWRMTLVLMVTLFLSLSLGMFVSAVNREARQAMAGTFTGMLLLAGVSPALYWLQLSIFHRSWTNLFLLPSPVFAFTSALDSHYGTGSGGRVFWNSLLTLGGLGVGCLVLAAVLLPRVWHEKGRRPKAEAESEDLGFADPQDGRVSFFRACRTINPFLWLASRQAGVGSHGRVLAGSMLGIWLCSLCLSIAGKSSKEAFIVALFSGFALHVVLKCLVAIEASRQLSEDRQSGALELLLVSPLKEAQILAGQSLALTRRFAGWGAVLVLVNLAMAATTVIFPRKLQMSRGDVWSFQEIFFGGILVLWLDFRALVRVGMWMGVRAGRHHRAVLRTLGRVLLPAWGAIFLVVFIMNNSRVNSDAGVRVIFALWFMFGMVVDLIMIAAARTHLRRGFRALLGVAN